MSGHAFSSGSAEELRAVLGAWRVVRDASWPHLHPVMPPRAARWPAEGEAALRSELEGYLGETDAPGSSVRVFWKLGPKFVFGGANAPFARDAGLPAPALLGADDFDARLPWAKQAAKYRADDREVFDTGLAKLGILERQTSSTGAVVWVHVGKAPIKDAAGVVIGVFGMYELVDDKTAQKLFFDRTGKST
jgi:hypothetical protein